MFEQWKTRGSRMPTSLRFFLGVASWTITQSTKYVILTESQHHHTVKRLRFAPTVNVYFVKMIPTSMCFHVCDTTRKT